MKPVGDVAVEGARLHGDAAHSCKSAIRDVEGLQHPETWRKQGAGGAALRGGTPLNLTHTNPYLVIHGYLYLCMCLSLFSLFIHY